MKRLLMIAALAAAPSVGLAHTNPHESIAEMQGTTPVRLALSLPGTNPLVASCPIPQVPEHVAVLQACLGK